MSYKPKKESGFSKKSIETKFKGLGYIGLFKSISPSYNKEAEEIKLKSKTKVFDFLLVSKPPKKEVLKEAIHFFAGYDSAISSILILYCAHKAHRYNSDITPFLIERIDSCRSPQEREMHTTQFLKESSDLAKKLFLKAKDDPKSFVFGVNFVDFLEKRINLEQKQKEEVVIKKMITPREKPKNCFQNGFGKHGTPTKRRTIIRKIDFKRAPKRTYQKVMSN